VALVKPQFEVGRAAIGRGGIVRDAAAREGAVEGVAAWLSGLGWQVEGRCESPVPGGDGNIEYLLTARAPPEAAADSPQA
ncbi:MAG: SAM-dependent methyltransferase, partial [Pseudomonadota bacterium]